MGCPHLNASCSPVIYPLSLQEAEQSVPRGEARTTGETSLSSAVCGFEQRIVTDDGVLQSLKTYGIVDGGLELGRLATSKLKLQWTVRRPGPPPPSWGVEPQEIYNGYPRLPPTVIEQCPVDLLLAEYSHLQQSHTEGPKSLEVALSRCVSARRPLYVVEAWDPGSAMWRQGPVAKLTVTRWKELGYATRCRKVNATAAGGALDQERLMVIRSRGPLGDPFEWASLETGSSRVMSNLLTPPGLVPSRCYRPEPLTSPPHSLQQAMPSTAGKLIRTPQGVRRLEVDEFIRGLGGTPEGRPCFGHHPLRNMANRSTSLFHWEYVLGVIAKEHSRRDTLGDTTHGPQRAHETSPLPQPGVQGNTTPFRWKPPDLRPGSRWYEARMTSLRRAAQEYPDPGLLVREGIEALSRHRDNYDAEGPRPTHLQLLWWEWPREHWDALRQGSPMNFLVRPEAVIHENSPMDRDQLKVAQEFVEELVGLGTLVLDEDGVVQATAPLFCIPKEGQPGQWRVIADMLRGGQNGAIGNDPVFLPRLLHILGDLYEGGYSAVVDASKFFYQFRTHPDDQPYLGIKHPITGELYSYHGLPMGSGNSPALGSRYGLAFLRKLIKEHPDLFQGRLRMNGFLSAFSPHGQHHPGQGEGYVIDTVTGLVVKVWAFVDDFLIHAPTEDLCRRALSAFLDAALDCGMLCHPKKLVPPGQLVRYCGLLLDTREVPTLRMPQDKKDKASAMVEHVIRHPQRQWSRLALSVLAGVLESLAECTPQRIGHTHLRALHSLVHPEGVEGGLEAYLSTTQVDEQILSDLLWWRDHLQEGKGRVVRAQASGALVPTFGDGSGTGTGGTITIPGAPPLMWRGQWSPTVFSFTSNWKELTTLLLTLEQLKRYHARDVKGVTLFYFTDNSATYWICQKGSSRHPHLHEQVVKIRALETQLSCHLWVIHVPGRVMIQEGTDGLSRGVWMTPLQQSIPREVLMPAIFAPMAFHPQVVEEYVRMHIPHYIHDQGWELPEDHPRWHGRRWDAPWEAEECFNRLTVWFPPPEVARGTITFILNCRVEVPLATSALFFIPRILPAAWRGLNRALVELPPIDPRTADLSSLPVLPIPITVLYLPGHRRRPPSRNKLDKAPAPWEARWHQQQANELRRVHETGNEHS